MNIKELDCEYITHTYARFDVQMQSGSGALCYDENNKEYIDFTSGIGVNSLGFCDKGWAHAVAKQAQTLNHTSNLYYTAPSAILAQKLCERTGFKKVFFANSGAEANEGAIKAVRKYSFDKYGAGRCNIITLVNSFHGRTISTLAATGQDSFHTHFMPFTDGFKYAVANDFSDIFAKADKTVCAIMLELIQGEGGVVPLEQNYVNSVKELCEQNDILLIIDEVQTGIGRTGSFLCAQQFDVKADITTLAKGLGGGLPIGAVLFGEKCEKVLSAGTHGSTFGANPIACAGANYIIDSISNDLLAQVAQNGKYIKKCLAQMDGVNEISGMGMMLGIDVNPNNAREIAVKCLENGLMILTAKTKLRMLPPLNITRKQLEKGLDILQKVLKECAQ